MCNFLWRSVQGFGRGNGSNFPFSHWLASSPLQHSRTTVRVCDSYSPLQLSTFPLSDIVWSRRISSSLPETCTALPATGKVTCELPLSAVNGASIASDIKPVEQLGPWLSVVEGALSGKTERKSISFAAYHSEANLQTATAVCNSTLLPLLPDHIQSLATVRHPMNVVVHLTSTTNNGQPAVITADQPVYAICKSIQWTYPELYGEDRMVLMMGGLHMEMSVQNMTGKWLDGNG